MLTEQLLPPQTLLFPEKGGTKRGDQLPTEDVPLAECQRDSKPVAMQDSQGSRDGARVTLRDGTIPQKLRPVVRAVAEKLRAQFEQPALRRVAA